MALVSSDRSSLIPAVMQSERPQGWDDTTAVETGELHPVAEQASCCRTSIPSVGTPPRLSGLEARTQRNITVFTGWGESSCLSVNISRFLEGQPKYFEQLLAQTPGLCGICNNLIPHNNNPSYILLFYGMYAWLPFLSKGIL